MIDENKFFREVSIRMCGSLDIDKALSLCFRFVSQIMPVDELMILTYDFVTKCFRSIATADSHGGHFTTDEIFLTPEAQLEIEKREKVPQTRNVRSIGEDTIVDCLSEELDWPLSSVLINRLVIEGKYIGSFLAIVKGEKRYTDEHLKLWGLVNEPAAIALANHMRYREIIRIKELLADDKYYLQNELRSGTSATLIGADYGLKEVMENIRLVAPLLSPVLLIGETGTGKEVIANAIHELSPKSNGPLIKVNCGAIPEMLVDSELFGHEKGAFTGAIAQKRGRFERANGGTIFLDEVSELPLPVQVRLLRVLQEKEIERVGGNKTIKVDVRIISATNRNLEELIKNGRFREDLFFRLNVFPILVPPLRERKNDIPILVHHFIHKKAREMALPQIPIPSPGELDRLMRYDWPGNVRELENVVERAIILSKDKPITFGDVVDHNVSSRECKPGKEHDTQRLDELEAQHIEITLNKVGGRVSGKGGAADLLGVNPNTLRHRMKKLGISFGRK
ncbi:MAG: sigma 54-interacting transcriptional regulator [Smithella sp.]